MKILAVIDLSYSMVQMNPVNVSPVYSVLEVERLHNLNFV
jgi:hypothetical protein